MSTDTTRPETRERFGLLALLTGLGFSGAVLAVLLPLAHSHRGQAELLRRIERAETMRAEADRRGALYVPWTDRLRLATDPHDPVWNDPPAAEIELQAQKIAMPMLEQPSLDTARIQALTDGKRIVWRVAWRDDDLDANVDSGRFSDAVALQFPLARFADFSMGGPDKPVHILHWKALWQKDVDEHFQDVQDLHPNYWADLYWFAGGHPYRVPDSFSDPRSHAWFVAYSAGNPMADIYRQRAVEELLAEGFGSLTRQQHEVADGRGAWRDGEWAVVFLRPMQSGDPTDYQFWRGGSGQVGIAVWDGAENNVGGRKHWTNWLDFSVSPR